MKKITFKELVKLSKNDVCPFESHLVEGIIFLILIFISLDTVYIGWNIRKYRFLFEYFVVVPFLRVNLFIKNKCDGRAVGGCISTEALLNTWPYSWIYHLLNKFLS